MRTKQSDDDYPVNSILDILSNTMGFILLIMMTLTLLAYSRSIYTGEADSIPIRLNPDSNFQNDVLPLNVPPGEGRYPVYVLIKTGKIYRLDASMIYPVIIDCIDQSISNVQMNAGDFFAEINLNGVYPYGLSLRIDINESAGYVMDITNTNGLISVMQYLRIHNGDNTSKRISPDTHYFILETYPDSYPEYQWLNTLLYQQGYDTGVAIAMKNGKTNWSDLIFGDEDQYTVQFIRD